MFFFLKKKVSLRNENLRKSGSEVNVKLQTGVLQIKTGSRDLQK